MDKTAETLWANSETVLLDMDGTLLDLAFDNRFWLERVPAEYARHSGQSPEAALADLRQQMQAVDGQLQWYCLDYWSNRLGFDLNRFKQQFRGEIRMLPGIAPFLEELTASGRRVALATNAHPDVLSLKLAQTGLDHWISERHTAHDFGASKESPRFWQALEEAMGFKRQSTLFVDDSLSVLSAARDFGIGHLRAISRPASDLPPRPIREFPAVEALPELGPVPRHAPNR